MSSIEMIFGCPQFYVQGPSVLGSITKYLRQLCIGKQILIVIDKGIMKCVDTMLKSLREKGIPYEMIIYEHQITLDKIDVLVKSF